mgnify:CR=1 FL=1
MAWPHEFHPVAVGRHRERGGLAMTQSLRWPIAAHLLTDLFNLSVAMFLGLYVPPVSSMLP